MNEEIQRELGRHEAEIESLKEDMSEVKADVKTILKMLNETRGGWKTLILLGGLAGALGALISKLIIFLGVSPK